MSNCKICQDARRGEIENGLHNREQVKKLALDYGCSENSIRGHRARCMGLARPGRLGDVIASGNHPGGALESEIGVLEREATRLQADAEQLNDLKGALAALAERRRLVELRAELAGLRAGDHQTSVLNFNLDARTARRMAEVFLARQRLLKAGGGHVN